jgi:hypothetical protein
VPTEQAASDRALATLNKICRQELLGAGKWLSLNVLCRSTSARGYAQTGATHDAAWTTQKNANRCSCLIDFRELSFVR